MTALTAPTPLSDLDAQYTSTPIAAVVDGDRYGPRYFTNEHDLGLCLVETTADVVVYDLDRHTGQWAPRAL